MAQAKKVTLPLTQRRCERSEAISMSGIDKDYFAMNALP